MELKSKELGRKETAIWSTCCKYHILVIYSWCNLYLKIFFSNYMLSIHNRFSEGYLLKMSVKHQSVCFICHPLFNAQCFLSGWTESKIGQTETMICGTFSQETTTAWALLKLFLVKQKIIKKKSSKFWSNFYNQVNSVPQVSIYHHYLAEIVGCIWKMCLNQQVTFKVLHHQLIFLIVWKTLLLTKLPSVLETSIQPRFHNGVVTAS